MNITDAVKKGFYLECIAVIRQGDSVHVTDSSAIQGFPGFIDLLLHSGANMNVKSKKFGLTPLHLATIRNKKDNPNLTKEEYLTLLHLFNQRKGERNNSAEFVKSISNSLLLTYAQCSKKDQREKLRDSQKPICKVHVKIA